MIELTQTYADSNTRKLTVTAANKNWKAVNGVAVEDTGCVLLQTAEAGQVMITEVDQPQLWDAFQKSGAPVGSPDLAAAQATLDNATQA